MLLSVIETEDKTRENETQVVWNWNSCPNLNLVNLVNYVLREHPFFWMTFIFPVSPVLVSHVKPYLFQTVSNVTR